MAWNGTDSTEPSGPSHRTLKDAGSAAAAIAEAQNSSDGRPEREQTLNIQYFCTKLRDKVKVLFRLEPLEPPKNIYGKREAVPQIPMRIVFVLDVSHSMAEPYGADTTLSKLERIKLFAKLLINTIGHEDNLSIVTFGTTAEVVVPLKKMSSDNKQHALRQIEGISVRGVTNMSAGIFAAIDQFNINVTFAKNRSFNDNIIIFTDGMANEGITETDDLIREIHKKIKVIKEECHYENDYVIKFSALGTGGFMPELLYNIGQSFSSDAFFFLYEDASMELDLMLPILLKQTCAVDSLKVTVSGLNGVQFDFANMPCEYGMVSEVCEKDPAAEKDKDAVVVSSRLSYFVYDIAYESTRHISCCLRLPHKHKKLLKGKQVLRIVVSYRDAFLCTRTTEKSVAYAELPVKENKNDESSVLVAARHECRLNACDALERTARLVAKLDRTAAKEALQTGVFDLRGYFEFISDFCSSEEGHIELSDWVDLLVANLEKCDQFVGDFAVRWDDVWGRVKALQSSLSREVPSSTGVYADGAVAYSSPKVTDKLHNLSELLREMYVALGMCASTLDRYQKVVEELEMRFD